MWSSGSLEWLRKSTAEVPEVPVPDDLMWCAGLGML